MKDTVLRDVQIPVTIGLVAGSAAYVLLGSFFLENMNDFQVDLMRDLKVVVLGGIIASFALLGLGRRASTDK